MRENKSKAGFYTVENGTISSTRYWVTAGYEAFTSVFLAQIFRTASSKLAGSIFYPKGARVTFGLDISTAAIFPSEHEVK